MVFLLVLLFFLLLALFYPLLIAGMVKPAQRFGLGLNNADQLGDIFVVVTALKLLGNRSVVELQ